LCFEKGGDPNQLMVSPFHSTTVSNFAYVAPIAGSGAGDPAVRQRDVGQETRLVNKVDLYSSPFGDMSVVTNKWIRGATGTIGITDAASVNARYGTDNLADEGNVFLLEVDRWFMPVLQPMVTEPIAKVGHADRRLVSVECSVGHEHRDASGIIMDLETS
jgi:hypothetical protein